MDNDTALASTTGGEPATSGADDLFAAPAGTAPSEGLQTATDTDTSGTAAPDWQAIINTIPDNDDDIAQPNFQHVEAVKNQRQQLRTLSTALQELQPAHARLTAYQGLGEPVAIKAAVELTNLLYSPLVDPRTNRPVVDPATQTSYVTTKPFLSYLDQQSPGMPEQLLVDLLDFEPTDEAGNKTAKLKYQVLRHWGLDPNRMEDYKRIDTQPAMLSRAITPDELKNIPAEYHTAYSNLPPSIRNAWDAYDEPDQLVMLRNEADRLVRIDRDNKRDEEDKQAKATEAQNYRAMLAREQAGYIATVREERFASIAEQLSKQIVFSADPTTNTVLQGAVGTVLWNLIDPDGRFISEAALAALGVKLDHTFDETLNAFNTNAKDYVALALQGDEVRANQAQEKANAAANLLTTKLGIIALKYAKAMGGQQQAAAAAQGQALTTATTARVTAGNGSSPNGTAQGVLPPHIRPGSPEAARWLAESTGFWRPQA